MIGIQMLDELHELDLWILTNQYPSGYTGLWVYNLETPNGIAAIVDTIRIDPPTILTLANSESHVKHTM